jgi:hypothetical protein
MSPKALKKGVRYPYSRIRVYWSAAIVVASIVLAILALKNVILLLYYLLVTFLLVVVVFTLKMRYISRIFESQEEKLSETEDRASRWKSLLLLVTLVILFLLLPLFLAKFHPEVWFLSLISYASGVSIAEVIFFWKTK